MILFICSLIKAQQKTIDQSQQYKASSQRLFFSYKDEGNQTERKFIPYFKIATRNTEPKEISAINEEMFYHSLLWYIVVLVQGSSMTSASIQKK